MKKVFIIEDEILFQRTLIIIFEQYGYEVMHAKDGKEAMLILEGGYIPDILITDLMIPYVSGLEIIGWMKLNPITKNIPIIVLSALNNETSVVEAFKIGIDDYIKKPVIPRELLVRVERLLIKQSFVQS